MDAAAFARDFVRTNGAGADVKACGPGLPCREKALSFLLVICCLLLSLAPGNHDVSTTQGDNKPFPLGAKTLYGAPLSGSGAVRIFNIYQRLA